MKELVEALKEALGDADNEEYRWLKPVYELIESSKDIEEAESRLREIKRFASSMWGFSVSYKQILENNKSGELNGVES